MNGGIYEGPSGQRLHGDGRPVSEPPAAGAAPCSVDTLLVIETSEGQSFRGKVPRATALKVANFILAAPEKAPNQHPTSEGNNTATADCGDLQSNAVPSSAAGQPYPPNDKLTDHEP